MFSYFRPYLSGLSTEKRKNQDHWRRHSSLVKWFASCLESRYQVTSVESRQSPPCEVLVGLLQGSNLGPLLFLVYANDLPNCLEHCQVIMYAEDTVIHWFSGKCCQDVQYHVHSDLANLAEWFNSNIQI